jgi:hypothetical protein
MRVLIVEHLPRANEYPSAAEVRARIEAGWRPWNRVPVEFDHPAREPLPGGHIEEPRTIYLTFEVTFMIRTSTCARSQ